jgi:hypothetical protein
MRAGFGLQQTPARGFTFFELFFVYFRTYAKLRWLGVEPKTVQMYDEANTTTPASVLRKSYSLAPTSRQE